MIGRPQRTIYGSVRKKSHLLLSEWKISDEYDVLELLEGFNVKK